MKQFDAKLRPAIALVALCMLGFWVGPTSTVKSKAVRSGRPAANQEFAPFDMKAVSVIDGDTFRLEDGRKVRYVGIDAPEQGDLYFEQATRLHARLVGGRTVRVVPCLTRPKDPHDRLLAQVFVDGKNVEQAMLSAGLATVFDDVGCAKNADALWRILIQAYDRGAGMWVQEPRTAIESPDAIGNVGSFRKVTGIVSSVVRGKNHTFVNFEGNWRTTGFSIRIPKTHLFRFARSRLRPKSLLARKLVVFGKIEQKENGPYINCTSPSQILVGDITKTMKNFQ